MRHLGYLGPHPETWVSPKRPTTLPLDGLLGSSEGPNGNFMKEKTSQLFSVTQQVVAVWSAGLGAKSSTVTNCLSSS